MTQPDVHKKLESLSSTLDLSSPLVSIIMAAGHGKRIKSEKSKMLHEIWGRPSVLRVCEAARKGLGSENQIIVVGKMALEVATTLGRRTNRVFVYQEEQRGTGHAVQAALDSGCLDGFDGEAYILPGDMGLLTESTVRSMRDRFRSCGCHMLILTGHYTGNLRDNTYGRIVTSRNHPGQIIEIKENKDIRSLDPAKPYRVLFRGKEERFTREELLNIREFNVGVYALNMGILSSNIHRLSADNAQGEFYVTDLIKILNDQGMSVASAPVHDSSVVSFNVKSVLKRMESTFRESIYERLKDVITIDDPEDFYIAEEAVERIEQMDGEHPALDITIGKGASIGPDVYLNRGAVVGRHAHLEGCVKMGTGVWIGEGAHLSTYSGQAIQLGDRCTILRGNVIKGAVKLGDEVRVETGVRITGSSEEPVTIGDRVLIKGTSYIFGAAIADDILVEHSVLKSCRVRRLVREDGSVQPVKYILPRPEGMDEVEYR